ncbi:MAG: glycosyltransferase family 4 protein [candidate division KSB1 bacterium]|nr:glycosyltransferase family 4 protein [candidate division KSB1 bacterium]MDZ7357039.1 glycosyltransferase family 4 protein [candidate division KSB1 bacterium]
MRKQFGWSDDTQIILFVGYLIEKKGIRYLLTAMPKIIAELPDAQLVLVGAGTELEQLKQQTKDLEIEDHVTFMGWVKNSDLPDYYLDADVFVLPSIVDSKGETETQGVVLAEAMVCGCPVVGSNVGGIPDVITPEVGLLAEPKNSHDLAKKIVMILSDIETHKKMSQAAISWAREHFSWQSVSRKYLEIYNEILNDN